MLLDVTADICRLVGIGKAYREAGGNAWMRAQHSHHDARYDLQYSPPLINVKSHELRVEGVRE